MRLYGLLIFAVAFLVSSCGGGNDLPSHGGVGGSITGGGGSGSTVQAATVTLVASPTSVTVSGSSSITATVLDSNSANVPDGTIVTFALSSSVMGSISSQATTSSGIATATFTASSTAGTVTITATAGSVSNTTNINITAPSSGSVVFTSATPQVLGLKGFGQTETSLVQFTVADINGNPVSDGTAVSFIMSGPGGGRLPANGGEYIGDLDASPTTASASTSNGIVSVFLHSGTLAGTVTIVATVSVSGSDIASSSTVISIGGGVPSATHFSLATSVLNLAGYTDRGSLGFVNEQATISAFIGDRFGNFNILEGSSVSFYTEAGAIDRSSLTDSSGSATVTFRTQDPMPVDVAPLGTETTLMTRMNTDYGISTTFHPRDGWVTILATLMGEEAFNDANANGLYDSGETFTDLGEPFYDKNNDGLRDDGSSDPFEEWIDANGNGVYDGPNGCWDGPNPSAGYTCSGRQDSKMIFDMITVMFTGHPANFSIACDASGAATSVCNTQTSFTLENAEVLVFDVVIGDVNLNVPVGGTTISVASTAGKLTAFEPSPVADTVSAGPVEFSFILADASVTDDPANPAEPVIISVEVTWKGTKYVIFASGTVD
jgi:hypothetical protein